MKLSFERTDGVVVITSSQRIDSSNARAFERAVGEIFEDSDRALVMDCGPLEYIGSAGLRAFIVIARNLIERGAGFSICALRDPIQQVFAVGVDKFVSIHTTKEEGIASFSS